MDPCAFDLLKKFKQRHIYSGVARSSFNEPIELDFSDFQIEHSYLITKPGYSDKEMSCVLVWTYRAGRPVVRKDLGRILAISHVLLGQ